MSSDSSPSGSGDRSPPGDPAQGEPTAIDKDAADKNGGAPPNDGSCSQNGVVVQSRSGRPTRACTVRAAARYQQQLAQVERKPKATPKKEQRVEEPPSPPQQCGSRVVTPLVEPPPESLLPRWNLRCMWELASVLNFLHVFRPLLNISIEFSAEEFETALLTPNDTLAAIHMPLMKAIPPVTRMALTRDTWITVLCRKLRDWWHWVAEGELPIVASHGTEIEVYRSLDPSVRVVILKALCDIRVEQEDIRNYIENSLKHGAHLSAFRKERVGGDSYGVHYWYEDDPIIGHRLYRETRKVEVKRAKAKGSQVIPIATYQWETVATNFDEFEDVSEKLFSSSNRTEVSLGKKLKIDMLPDIEREHRRKEKLLKKQQREALLLDNFIIMDGLGPGRSLRDRKPVTYTFDDYDRSINEAIKITKRKQSSPEAIPRREGLVKQEVSANGNWTEGQHASSGFADFSAVSPNSPYSDGADEEEDPDNPEQIDRRRRKRPQRYSDKDFVEAVSDMEADLDDSDDDIVGEAVYDEEYLRKRKQRKLSSSSEGDEEYHMDDENAEEEYQVDEEDEEEDEDSLGVSEDSDDDRPKFKKLRGRTRRETKLRSVKEIHSGLRRSKRATRNRINYRHYEYSDSDAETTKKPEKWNQKRSPSNEHYSEEGEEEEEEEEEEASEGPREVYSDGSRDNSENNDDGDDEEQELKTEEQPVEGYDEPTTEKNEFEHLPNKLKGPSQEDDPLDGAEEEEEEGGSSKWGFLDLNELAPGSSGFDDGPPLLPPNNTTVVKDAEDRDDL